MKKIIFLGMICLLLLGIVVSYAGAEEKILEEEFPYFGKVSKTEVLVYFLWCDDNFNVIEPVAVKRKVNLHSVIQHAIEKLLEGPSDHERKRYDLWSAIPSGTKLNNLWIDIYRGICYVDFSKELQNYKGGSLNAICIRTQIEKTLKQFKVVKKVIITVEGKGEAEGVLQP